MKKIKVSLISLGCEKNLVDSELILGMIDSKKLEFEIVTNPKISDVVIINTCGFIESAKKEALDTIFEWVDYKINNNKNLKIVVCGCLTERYYDELVCDIPEVDLFVPIKDYFKFGDLFLTMLGEHEFDMKLDYDTRLVSTGSKLAYLRISDGCNNRCSYCAIPLIRGNFKSRSHNEVAREFEKLVNDGYKEICLISQDLSNYGYDINDSLASLLKDLDKVDGDYFIRLLYLYPDEITDEFIDVVKESKHIIHYFDIPLQHASNKILHLMNRRGTKEDAKNLINKIREKMADAIIRTTIIVGFPHESEKDFKELLDFVKEMKFDHLGAFTYSKEEDTKSFDMTMQVPERVKVDRYNKLMEVQRWVSSEAKKKFLGKEYIGLVEKYDYNEECYLARIYLQAPDDIDGYTKIYTNDLKIDKFYKIRIIDSEDYDLIGEIIDD